MAITTPCDNCKKQKYCVKDCRYYTDWLRGQRKRERHEASRRYNQD